VAFKVEKNSRLETASRKHRIKKEEMVFIEEKSAYLQKFGNGNDFCFFKEYLQKKQTEPLTEDSSLVSKLLYALASNEISPVSKLIEENSNKIPTPDSPYIYKDLQIFLFICVTKKFGLEQSWILKFVENRKSEEQEKNSITKTFQNLLKDNLISKDNYFEIVIVYKEILGSNELDETILNETYEKLSRKEFPFYNSDFLNLVAIKAIDFIVLSKGLTDFRSFKNLTEFSGKFDKRIRQIAIGTFYLIAFSLFTPLIYIGYKLFYGTTQESAWADKIFTVVAIVITILAFIGFFNKTNIVSYFETKVKVFFGRKDEIE
jgi:hypothetical protein